jgi:hypothetical protein
VTLFLLQVKPLAPTSDGDVVDLFLDVFREFHADFESGDGARSSSE